MTRRLLASYLALTVVVLLALEVPLAIVNARNERNDLIAKVERDAFVAASLSEDALQSGGVTRHLTKFVLTYQTQTGGRVVIVDRRGRSIADSQHTATGETVFATRPEIAAALRGNTVSGDPELGDTRPQAALRRGAGRLGRPGVRSGSHHLPDLDARSAHQPLPACARRRRVDGACRRRADRLAAGALDLAAVAAARDDRRPGRGG